MLTVKRCNIFHYFIYILVKCDSFRKRKFSRPFLTTMANTLEERGSERRRVTSSTYIQVSLFPPSEQKAEKKEKNLEEKCNEESPPMCWRIEKNIFRHELSLRNEYLGMISIEKVYESRVWFFPNRADIAEIQIWILASRVNKIADKVSWYQITFPKRWRRRKGGRRLRRWRVGKHFGYPFSPSPPISRHSF